MSVPKSIRLCSENSTVIQKEINIHKACATKKTYELSILLLTRGLLECNIIIYTKYTILKMLFHEISPREKQFFGFSF